MVNGTPITIIGNATNAELRFSPAGKAVCNFRLASTPRHFDKQSGQWEDGETLWLNCSLWGQPAENFVETVGDTKGMRVIVTGRLKQRSYETREGEKRTVFEIDVDDIGPSLMWATAAVTRTGNGRPTSSPAAPPRTGSTPTDRQPARRPQQTRQAPAADPWATGGQGSLDDVPPF